MGINSFLNHFSLEAQNAVGLFLFPHAGRFSIFYFLATRSFTDG
jgi:hypothetical protein